MGAREELVEAMRESLGAYSVAWDFAEHKLVAILATRPHLAAALLPETHAVVPVEPTEEMLNAAFDGSGPNYVDDEMRDCWAAMVAAAAPKGDDALDQQRTTREG